MRASPPTHEAHAPSSILLGCPLIMEKLQRGVQGGVGAGPDNLVTPILGPLSLYSHDLFPMVPIRVISDLRSDRGECLKNKTGRSIYSTSLYQMLFHND